MRGELPQGPRPVDACLGSAPTGGWSEKTVYRNKRRVVGGGGHWEQIHLARLAHGGLMFL